MRIRHLVTCEHGGNRVPPRWRALFADDAELLASHRGHDPGALDYARDLARRLRAPLVASTTTRLLVDLNRAPRHRRLFSERTRPLPDAERALILERHYAPHHAAVRAVVARAVRAGAPFVHVAAHSFTPVWDGVPRTVDVGFLYDPRRPAERRVVDAWIAALRSARPDLRVRRNAPYRGVSDGLPTRLRREVGDAPYAGVEVEVSQALTTGDARTWRALRRVLVDVLARPVPGAFS